MRRAIALGMATCASYGFAQSPGSGVVSKAMRMLQERDLVDRPPNPSATDPTRRAGDLPAPDPFRKPFKVSADDFKQTGSKVSMRGNVEFEHKGYKVFADRVDGDLDTGDFHMEGGVKVIGKDALIQGDRVSINTNLRTFVAESAKCVLRPSLVKGSIRDDLFVKGSRFEGDERRQLGAEDDVTTCNLDEPHYALHARKSDLIPGDRLILRHVDLFVFGKKRLTIPFLLIPLREQKYNYLPEVGQSPDEGYYVKNRIGIPLHGDRDRLVARVDYMSKLGLGLGEEFVYKRGSIAGGLRVYSVFGDSRTLTINHSHRQEFRWGSLSLDTDYQQNNYLSAPGSTLTGIRGSLALKPDSNGSSTRLSFSRSGSASDTYSASNDSASISDQRVWNKRFRTTLDATFTSTQSSFSGGGTATSNSRRQIDVRFRGDEDLKQATATLEIQRSIPVGHLDNFFGGADRYPVLTLTSDSSKLYGTKPIAWPFRTELSIGSLADPVTQSNITRTFFDIAFQRSNAGKGKLRWDTTAELKQALYSDDTAQYVLNGGTQFNYAFGKNSYANLSYNYNRPYGYSPLQIDRMGYVHSANLNVNYKMSSRWLLGLQTGYDIARLDTQDVPWQQIGVKTEYSVKDFLLWRTQYTYDTFNEAWSNVRLDLSWKRKNQTIGFGARFDGLRHTWSTANFFMENLTTGKTTLSASLNYNGFTQQFDTQQYNLVYSLHCWEAVLTVTDSATGFRSGREINLFLRLKAFPFQSPFGQSRQGSPINFGTGTGF